MGDYNDEYSDDFWLDIIAYDDDCVDFPEYHDPGDEDTDNLDYFKKWTRLSADDIDVSITTDSTGSYLLRRCKEEFTTISSRVLSRANAAGESTVSISFVLNLFVMPLVPILRDCMNSSIADIDVPSTDADVIEFIRCLVILSFYGVTPTNFFDKENEEFYPIARDRSHDTFKQFYIVINCVHLR